MVKFQVESIIIEDVGMLDVEPSFLVKITSNNGLTQLVKTGPRKYLETYEVRDRN